MVNTGPSKAAAAVFTSNRCKANPVLWSEEAIKGGSAVAVAINSGGANCYTGPEGFATTHQTAETVAEALGVGAIDVQVCSTGLIGLLNDREPLLSGVRAAVDGLSVDGGHAAADRDHDDRHGRPRRPWPKATAGPSAAWPRVPACWRPHSRRCSSSSRPTPTSTPRLPTQPCALRRPSTFDRLDSDGCQSTNDTVLLMASGASGVAPDLEAFTDAITTVCLDLAKQLLADAEGADHEIAIEVVNAATLDDALEVGRSVARSNLFKCAIYGKDPNWGRILASVGTTQAAFDPADLDVALNGVWVCRASGPGSRPTRSTSPSVRSRSRSTSSQALRRAPSGRTT